MKAGVIQFIYFTIFVFILLILITIGALIFVIKTDVYRYSTTVQPTQPVVEKKTSTISSTTSTIITTIITTTLTSTETTTTLTTTSSSTTTLTTTRRTSVPYGKECLITTDCANYLEGKIICNSGYCLCNGPGYMYGLNSGKCKLKDGFVCADDDDCLLGHCHSKAICYNH